MIRYFGSALLAEAIGEPDDPWDQLVEAVTDTSEVAFERAVREALANAKRYDRQAVSDLLQYLNEFHDMLAGTLGNVELTEFGQHRYEAVRDAITRARQRLLSQMDQLAGQVVNRQASLAVAAVDGPLRAVLGGSAGLPLVDLPLQQIQVIRGYLPELIVGISDETMRKVQTTLAQRLMGGLDAVRARRRIESLVGALPKDKGKPARELEAGKIFSRERIRAENILRTEMNRVYNVTHTDRIQDVALRVPGVGEVWIHNPSASYEPRRNHVEMHGQMIFPGSGEKFTLYGRKGGTYSIAGPHDPVLPAEESINCHCRTRIAYSAEIAEEQKRRGIKAPRASSRKN